MNAIVYQINIEAADTRRGLYFNRIPNVEEIIAALAEQMKDPLCLSDFCRSLREQSAVYFKGAGAVLDTGNCFQLRLNRSDRLTLSRIPVIELTDTPAYLLFLKEIAGPEQLK
jgi:hypothetical protein